MKVMNKVFDAEKHKLFGEGKSDKEILHEFFNRELVNVLEEHLLVSAVAFHLVSETNLSLEEDVTEELKEVLTLVYDYLTFVPNYHIPQESYTLYGLFYGLYLDEHNSLTESEYGGFYEIKLGNLPVYNSLSGREQMNLVNGVFLKTKYNDLTKSQKEVNTVLRFLISYINENLKNHATVEFFKAVKELVNESYNINESNIMLHLAEMLEIPLTEGRVVSGEVIRKAYYSDFITKKLTLEEMFFTLSSNYLSFDLGEVK